MSTSTEATQTDRAAQRTTRRLAGLGALGFAIGVMIQNFVLLVDSPEPGSPVAEAAAWYAANSGRAGMASAIVALNFPLILLFAVCMRRLGEGSEAARRWLLLAALGTTGMVAVFGLVAATQITSVLLAESGATEAFTVAWVLHNAAFAVNVSVLGTAFLGFALGAHAAGLTPAWQRSVGVAGSGLLLVTGLANLAVADGSPVVFVGLAGFGLWLLWLVTIAIRLLRRP